MTAISLNPRTLPRRRATSPAAPVPTARDFTIAGRIVTGIPVAFLLFDAVIKLLNVPAVTEAMKQTGFPDRLGVKLGILLLTCLVIYVIPRTAVLGAILLTGYLGGAVVTHVRVGNPLFSHILFPVYVGVMLWGGLFLRDARVRALIPLRGTNA